MKIAVVGATGQVGTVMRAILRERAFPVDDIRFFASARSAGSTLEWDGELVTVEDASTADFSGIDVALASSGATSSRELSPRIAQAGAIVVDNSSAWRMDPEVPLVVAGVNDHALASIPKGIVANPNCTTMAAMPVMKALDSLAGLVSMSVSTYQAVSGAGRDGVEELAAELEAPGDPRALTFDGSALPMTAGVKFPITVAHNVVPMAGAMLDDGSGETVEERKLRDESRKILELPDLEVDVTCVRVPVFTGHSMTVTASFSREVSVDEALAALASAPGVVVTDLPTPRLAAGKDPTYVGRVRAATSVPNGLTLFLTGDNLRKGAALNTVQIAELLERRS
jgi:aspartate-semialdehyde dehydrogenase